MWHATSLCRPARAARAGEGSGGAGWSPAPPLLRRDPYLARLLGGGLRRQLDLVAEVLHRHVELVVLERRLARGLGRYIAARDDLLLAQVLVQGLQLVAGQRQPVALVRDHAPVLVLAALGAGAVEVLAGRPPEGGVGQFDLAALERLDVLYTALAVAALAHDDGPVVVLQAGGHDLAAAGAVAVDQAHHREVEQAVFVLALVLRLPPHPWLDGNDQAVVDEDVRDVHRAGEQPARVEAQVEDEALDAAVFEQAVQGRLEVVLGVPRELGQADIADAALRVDDIIPRVVGVALDAQDGFHLHLAALDLELQGLVDALALDRDLDGRAGPARDLLHRLVDRQALRGDLFRFVQRLALVVDDARDLRDHVAGLDAGVIG